MNKDKLSGVFAPVVTPFIDGEVVYDKLADNIKRLNKTDLRGYLALGSNGELMSLTREERIKALATIIENKADDKTIMAGTGHESTKETIEFTQKAAELGADFASVLAPHYFKKRMSDEALVNHFTKVAESSKIPVLLYNAPQFTGLTLSAEVVHRLSSHENIQGMKDSSTGNIGKYILNSSPDFYVLAGSANFFFDGLILGAVGGVLSLANILPEVCCNLYQLTRQGMIEEARALHFKVLRLNNAVSGEFGVAGVKAAMDIAGYFGGEPRLPLLPLTDEDKKNMKGKLLASGFLSKEQCTDE